MDEQTEGQTKGPTNRQMDRWIRRQMDGHPDERMVRQMNGWRDNSNGRNKIDVSIVCCKILIRRATSVALSKTVYLTSLYSISKTFNYEHHT